jgi:hypothetical protein
MSERRTACFNARRIARTVVCITASATIERAKTRRGAKDSAGVVLGMITNGDGTLRMRQLPPTRSFPITHLQIGQHNPGEECPFLGAKQTVR